MIAAFSLFLVLLVGFGVFSKMEMPLSSVPVSVKGFLKTRFWIWVYGHCW